MYKVDDETAVILTKVIVSFHFMNIINMEAVIKASKKIDHNNISMLLMSAAQQRMIVSMTQEIKNAAKRS